ncbi:hypothetical protein ABEB36_006256 [Hypothenemus hampei]|uniref:Homeobox domain-containing protein n=1 Tax=Hypothenemus hampei TaxID=57062 RepID=A0ABD1ESW0_HYPHA
MTKVCRLCLTRLQRGSKYFNINAVESFTGFMPYRDQLTTCIPEMALDLIPNPVICNNCRNALKSSYDFKSRCLLVEKKIREYVESQPSECTNYNLLEIDISNLPKPAKFEAEASKEPPKLLPLLPKVDLEKVSHPPSILSNLLSIKDEVILPNPSEIEITNVKYLPEHQKKKSTSESPQLTQEVACTPILKDEHGLFTCNHCDKKFPNVPSLHTHKTRVHEEDYICNFCNVPFKTLQNLRKHNQQCQKVRSFATSPSVLAKRPHLPTKAKNHLKRWLFNHTDHPYPTDVEKQQLMKETNLSLLQVENWFINARRRILADLTRLKNMRGGIFRGRRSSGGRGRARNRMEIGKVYFYCKIFTLANFILGLEEELFEEDADALFEEEDHEETAVTSRLLRDLEEPEEDEPIIEMHENERADDEEDEEEEEEDDDEEEERKYSIEGTSSTEKIKLTDDVSLSYSTISNIKMEIDVDER